MELKETLGKYRRWESLEKLKEKQRKIQKRLEEKQVKQVNLNKVKQS